MELKNLKNKSKNELIKICKKKNIKGYSKFNKNELIKHMKIYSKKVLNMLDVCWEAPPFRFPGQPRAIDTFCLTIFAFFPN